MTAQDFATEAERQTRVFPVPVGFELTIGDGAYQYTRMNDQGIPYFKRVLRLGRLSKREYTIAGGWTVRLWLIDAYRKYNDLPPLPEAEMLDYKV